MSRCHKLWIYNRTYLIFQTYVIWSNRSHSLKHQRYTTLESKDIVIRKSEFVTTTQFLYPKLLIRLCDLLARLVLILHTSTRKAILFGTKFYEFELICSYQLNDMDKSWITGSSYVVEQSLYLAQIQTGPRHHIRNSYFYFFAQ